MRHLAKITATSFVALLPLLGTTAHADQRKNACMSATSWVIDVRHHSKGMSVFVPDAAVDFLLERGWLTRIDEEEGGARLFLLTAEGRRTGTASR